MTSLNKYLKLSALFSFLIPVGAGHGIGTLGLFEIFGFAEIFKREFEPAMTGSYEYRIQMAAILGLFGQIALVVAILLRKWRPKLIFICGGLLLTIIGYVTLTNNYFESSVDRLSFWGGIPFLTCASLLIVKTIQYSKVK